MSSYCIAEAATVAELADKVNYLIRCDWVPTGGLAVVPSVPGDPSRPQVVFLQAMYLLQS